MAITQITNHVAAAQARLISQYQGKPVITAIVGILAARTQIIENMWWSLLTGRSLATATAAQLDKVGRIVGRARDSIIGGSDDEVYRVWLRAQVLANQSSGTIPQIIAILQLVTAPGTTIQVINSGPASMRVILGGVAQTQQVAISQLLQSAVRMAGIHLVTEYLNATPANTFRFDGTTAQAFDNGQFAGAL